MALGAGASQPAHKCPGQSTAAAVSAKIQATSRALSVGLACNIKATTPEVTAAAAALADDFAPISDMRASAGYRIQVAANLLLKYGMDLTGTPVPRLTGPGAGLSADTLREARI